METGALESFARSQILKNLSKRSRKARPMMRANAKKIVPNGMPARMGVVMMVSEWVALVVRNVPQTTAAGKKTGEKV